MGKVLSLLVKKFSNKDISVKKSYKLMRFMGKISHPNLFNKEKYEDVFFNIDDRKIRCRFFSPQEINDKTKVIIFIHGGGWVSGCIESYTKTCLELSKRTGRMVIAIDYRLAPEYPYPCGLNDCYDIVNLLMDNFIKIGLKKKDICLMGDSAGGNLVAAISLKSRFTRDFKVKEQILLYPALQNDYSDTTKYKSVVINGKDYLLTQKQLNEYMDLYINDKEELRSPYVAPLRARFPLFQPKTLIITADKDPLRDEGRAYAKKLSLFLNKVTYYNINEAMHGFFSMTLYKNYAEEAYEKILEFLGDENEQK